jgi:hypothetical protein
MAAQRVHPHLEKMVGPIPMLALQLTVILEDRRAPQRPLTLSQTPGRSPIPLARAVPVDQLETAATAVLLLVPVVKLQAPVVNR